MFPLLHSKQSRATETEGRAWQAPVYIPSTRLPVCIRRWMKLPSAEIGNTGKPPFRERKKKKEKNNTHLFRQSSKFSIGHSALPSTQVPREFIQSSAHIGQDPSPRLPFQIIPDSPFFFFSHCADKENLPFLCSLSSGIFSLWFMSEINPKTLMEANGFGCSSIHLITTEL